MGMTKYDDTLHIISAQLSECGLTLAQRAVDGKSNEISAVQELLKELNIKGTANALLQQTIPFLRDEAVPRL